LKTVDPRCADLNYIKDEPLNIEARTIMTNNFAFGGVNTSLIFRLLS
jgi:3-oxoacyl-[acyl-carrier-protein] synthase II